VSSPFPFSAIVGQEEMKLALRIAAVDPGVGGVLIFGDRGTGKSTAVRALAALLPPIPVVEGCAYGCDPSGNGTRCPDCSRRTTPPPSREAPVPMVDLPLGATEDRVVGTMDLERALVDGTRRFEPGLLARANRGFLYIDEVNLLEDHLVDLLLDVAASGENVVEREGISIRHPARFVLVGSGNPEEGDLRPQLLDRFGLSVEVETPRDLDLRVEVLRRRDAYDRDPGQGSSGAGAGPTEGSARGWPGHGLGFRRSRSPMRSFGRPPDSAWRSVWTASGGNSPSSGPLEPRPPWREARRWGPNTSGWWPRPPSATASVATPWMNPGRRCG
jgi:energy-coupling factor transporter ATP-binding protein EcfA2